MQVRYGTVQYCSRYSKGDGFQRAKRRELLRVYNVVDQLAKYALLFRPDVVSPSNFVAFTTLTHKCNFSYIVLSFRPQATKHQAPTYSVTSMAFRDSHS